MKLSNLIKYKENYEDIQNIYPCPIQLSILSRNIFNNILNNIPIPYIHPIRKNIDYKIYALTSNIINPIITTELTHNPI